MRRLLVLLAPILVAAFAGAVFLSPHTAFGCTLDPAYNPLRGADAVVYGHVDRIAHDPARPEAPNDPSVLTIAVDRTLQGGPLPEFVEAHADIPLPNTPIMCPQLDRTKLIGRPGVFVLYRGADGSWSNNRMAAWFTDEPRESVPAEVLARLLEGTTSAAGYRPVASLEQAITSCGQPFAVQGSGWPARTFIIVMVGDAYRATGHSDSEGSFTLPVRSEDPPCPENGELTVVVQAPAFLDLQPVSFPVGIGATSPLPPDTGSGTAATGPTTREIILIAGAGSLLIGMVLLTAIAALSHPEAPGRRR